MTTQQILGGIGQFSPFDLTLFETYTVTKNLEKNDVLLSEGEVCKSFYYILSGAFFQFQNNETEHTIIDLHLAGEWMFNQPSLVEQAPSTTIIKAFLKSVVIELTLHSFHYLGSKSPAYLQFGKLLNQSNTRTMLYDTSLTPTEKYDFIKKARPQLISVFPVKMIASYLKIAPETLSRVRANF